MWRIPGPLIAGTQAFDQTFTVNTLIGDLYAFLGAPAGPAQVTFIIDGASLGDIRITSDFFPGSSFDFTCINGGQVVGLGGDGGDGADSFGSTGGQPGDGTDGSHAIDTVFAVSLDVDDGFLFGGGGGGGGGAYINLGLTGVGGGGGGGGRGFQTSNGGLGGSQPASPPGQDGTSGDLSTIGLGGSGGTPSFANVGGDGGQFGSAGGVGYSSDIYTGATNKTYRYNGGTAGTSGNAYFFTGASAGLTLSGAKSEATLRSEGRIKGEVADWKVDLPFERIHTQTDSGTLTVGFQFNNDGRLILLNDLGGDADDTGFWNTENNQGASFGDDYEVRIAAWQEGTWDAEAAAIGTWSALTADRVWSITSATGIESTAAYFEIRRNDVPLNPDEEVLCGGWLLAETDN